MDRSGNQAMVVAPSELTQPGKMDSNKQLVGRVIHCDQNDLVFSCYVLCGTGRRDLIYLAAWRELATVAQSALKDGSLVSLLTATLVAQKADKLKWSLSPCRMMIRFDKNLQVHSLTGKETFKLPGLSGKVVTDLPASMPTTSLAACACLREGNVAICVQVVDLTIRHNAELPEKSLCKAYIQQVDQKGTLYQAELTGFGPEYSEQMMSKLQSGKVYDILPAGIMAPNAQHAFGLRWSNKTIATLSNNTTVASRGATAGEEKTIQLSVWKEGGEKKDYINAMAMQVSASTLAHLVPEKGVQEAVPNDIWELPCVTILNITRNSDDAWGYKGCSICAKKVCAHGANERTCYNVDVDVSDHTATVDMKMWTPTMDVLLRSCGVEEPERGVTTADIVEIEERIRKKTWSLRCIIVEEQAYLNRGARNRLQVVSLKEQSPSFTGSEKMLFALQSDHSHVRPGIPYVFSSEVSVDAAEQVMTKTGQQIEMAELIIQLKGNPQSLTNDNEKGVRIIFKCVDLGDPNAVETSALWVLSLSNMLPVARLPHNKVLRVIAQPRVQDESLIQWQVIVSSDFDETDIDVWRRRKQWQGLKPRDEKAKRVSEIALATPKSKYIRTKEELQVSPGNIVQSHSVK